MSKEIMITLNPLADYLTKWLLSWVEFHQEMLKENYVFDKIPLDEVVGFFEDSLDNFIDDPYNKNHLLEYLKCSKE